MNFAPITFDMIKRHTEGAARQGVSRDALLARSLIDLTFGDRRDLISPTQYLLLCMNTVLAMEDATHGLGRAPVGAYFPIVGLRMALGCVHLEGAIQALARLYAAASHEVRIRLTTEAESAILSVRMEATDERDAAYLEENYLIWMFQHCLYVLGRPPPVSEVTLRDPLHFNLGFRHWGIGGRVSYGEVTSFRFPRRLLGEPPRSRAGANAMWECQRLWLEFLNRKTPTAPTAYVTDSGFVRFADLARDAGASPNTLRRRFQASHGGFRDARQRALVDAAAERLGASQDSVETIAADLGYSDARSFRRFLKSATGMTPQELRFCRRSDEQQVDARAVAELEAVCGRMNF